jgi:hypothetical protein
MPAPPPTETVVHAGFHAVIDHDGWEWLSEPGHGAQLLRRLASPEARAARRRRIATSPAMAPASHRPP